MSFAPVLTRVGIFDRSFSTVSAIAVDAFCFPFAGDCGFHFPYIGFIGNVVANNLHVGEADAFEFSAAPPATFMPTVSGRSYDGAEMDPMIVRTTRTARTRNHQRL